MEDPKFEDNDLKSTFIGDFISTPDSIEYIKSIDTNSSGQNVKFSSNTFKSMTINRFDNTNIKIDGDLSELVWKKAAKFGNYCEVSPGENTKPQVETEVMMYYDDDNLYFGFICYENEVTKLRSTLCERDKMFSDDFCGFFLDTYNEGRQAYELFVNPYGIQGDLMWNTPGNEDETFDMIWYSESKIYKDKWTVEIAIPFKSIRFPHKKVQDWQIQFLRIRPRENRYQYSLMPITRDDPTLFTHACKLNGVESVKGGKNFELLPYLIGTQSGSLEDKENSNSEFKNGKFERDIGFNVKYGITSNITTDLTLNPDYSQIESDAGIISVNNPVAYSFSEKRPFFLEGANIFQTPVFIVYTRAINIPFMALKMTGKIGKTEFGYLSAYDKKSPFILPYAETSDFILTDRTSLSNIFRVKQTLKDESYIGFIMTDREVNKEGPFTMRLLDFDSYKNNKAQFLNVDGYNRAFGLDGKLKFGDMYYLDFQLMKYVTKEINYDKYDAVGTFDGGSYTKALDGEYYTGYQSYAILNRSARYWNYNISYRDISPTGRSDNGYIGINDYREIASWQGYMFYPDSKTFLRIQPQFYGYIRSYYDGKPREQFLQPQVWIQFSNQISLSSGFILVNNEKFGGVFHEGVRRGYINFNINTLKLITLGGYFELGKYIIRSNDPSVGYGMSISLWATFKPLSNITMQNYYDYFEIEKGYKGEKIYAGYIFRNITSYNLTKDITMRLITEYNTFDGSFYLNPLGSYKPNPFTIFYIGFTDMFNDTDTPNGKPKYALSNRQFFLKMQYLFRL
ncbi:MAG: DUF5916 domain-containing protein [Ignavibacteriae bacterium]|nr:DUF5916 domain-containing protein [Ignavibacteriota bacterium]